MIAQIPNNIHAEPSAVGILLVSSALELIYTNTEALKVLFYPRSPEQNMAAQHELSPSRIRLLLAEGDVSSGTEHVFGRRRYTSRILPMIAAGNSVQTTVILLERSYQRWADVGQVAKEFHLTEREKETLVYLLEGNTSKQIAKQMGISPNTVKTYLRFIMVKMSVLTRSAILTKVLR